MQLIMFKPRIDLKARNLLCVRCRDRTLVDSLIRSWHSDLPNPPPGWRLAFLLITPNDIPIGVATWGRPIARMEDQETKLELTRLALSHYAPKNAATRFLALMRKAIKEEIPEIRCLISYHNADKHLGTIYKADNWVLVYEKFKEHTWTNRPGRLGTERRHKIKWRRNLYTVAEVNSALRKSWSAETAFGSWDPQNPALNQCAVTALVVQDYFGGSLMRCPTTDGGSHYWNKLPDGMEIDLTIHQFDQGEKALLKSEAEGRARGDLLSNPDTLKRYDILRDSVLKALVDNIIGRKG